VLGGNSGEPCRIYGAAGTRATRADRVVAAVGLQPFVDYGTLTTPPNSLPSIRRCAPSSIDEVSPAPLHRLGR
jgi:hypothetical protein